MRTTVDLPEQLFRRAKARAALEGKTFKELMAEFVEQGLRHIEQPSLEGRRERSALPIARPATGKPLPVFSNAELDQILDGE